MHLTKKSFVVFRFTGNYFGVWSAFLARSSSSSRSRWNWCSRYSSIHNLSSSHLSAVSSSFLSIENQPLLLSAFHVIPQLVGIKENIHQTSALLRRESQYFNWETDLTTGRDNWEHGHVLGTVNKKPLLIWVEWLNRKKSERDLKKSPLSIFRVTVFCFQPKNRGFGRKWKAERKNPPSLQNKQKNETRQAACMALGLLSIFWQVTSKTKELPNLAFQSGEESKKLL